MLVGRKYMKTTMTDGDNMSPPFIRFMNSWPFS